MSHTLTYHSIQNFKLCHHHIVKGISHYAPTPTWAHAYEPAPAQAHTHANATAPADKHTHANPTALHPQYCAAGSTTVIRKMTILRRWLPFMDNLVRSPPPPLHQHWRKNLFDVCVWKQVGLV
ncbi:hypothetical protein O181_101279 [Austropuccinia psidii MF-1]|uniref:Uncharacterized protein n=1 Tax=Austropuccinia psidii MF-1 TaxID=1389203 RepID=A0A9Q3JGV5_9BASI|nr:hypothetical protein [Austropuccinia psidii MF-1]